MRPANHTLLMLLASFTWLHTAHAAHDPAAQAKAIAPFVDEQTIVVVRVDLGRLEADPLIDKLVQIVPDAAAEQQQMRAGLQLLKEMFIKAGIEQLFLAGSSVDVAPRSIPLFVIIPSAGSDAQALAEKLPRPAKDWKVQPMSGAMILGQSRVIERLKKLQPHTRPQLEEAFRAAGDSALQVLLLPSNNDRRVIEELMPHLPQEIGGGPSTTLTRGLQWLALGMNAPPQLSLKLVVQSQDAAAAGLLQAKLREVLQIVSKLAAAVEVPPELIQAIGLIDPQVEQDRLVLNLSEADQAVQALLAAVKPAIERARSSARRAQSMNNLKQLALANHNHYDRHKRLTAIGNFDADGKPLLSWRVHLLPYLEQKALYDQFRLDEPWDSEHNRQLIGEMPPVFCSPASKHGLSSGLTVYREVSGEHTVFPGREGIEFKQITDGTSNTILFVEVDDAHAVIWTKPEGLPYNAENPAEGLGGQFEGGFLAAFCDGSVRFIPSTVPAETLRRLLLRDDGQPIPQF